MGRELAEVTLVENRLALKPWGAAAIEHIREHTKAQTVNASQLLTRWTTCKASDTTDQSNADLDATIKELEELTTDYQNKYKKYTKEILGEFVVKK